MTPFDSLHPAMRYHIVNTLGWTDIRPTQLEAIGPILAGENVLLLAPTAGGKTEAAIFPVLSRIAASGWSGVTALYVCPLKALLNNLEPRLQRYAAFAGLRAAVWHGDVGEAARKRILRDPPDVLLTTPESLEAILISVRIDHRALLGTVRIVVIDELHAFASDDRGWHLRFLIGRLERLQGGPIQRIGLSATVGNPAQLLAWLTVGRPGRVIGPNRPPADGDVTVDYVASVPNAVTVLSRIHRGERRLVFADSRARVEEVAAGLRAAGVRTFVSHASLSTDERRQAEAAFSAEPDCVIVATSTLELGLDVGDLDRVIQVGCPPLVSSFLQRMGRTGRRAGARRNFLFLATTDLEFLSALGIAGLWQGGFVDPVVPPAMPCHIYAQQMMALVLQEQGSTRPDIDHWLGEAADPIPQTTRDEVLQHMLSTGVLVETEGVISFGVVGEREFGRRHFTDLVAAFTAPLLLTVQHRGRDIGSVHPASLARRAGDAAPVLSLAGRSWTVDGVNWRKRQVMVVPAAGGGRSRWLGDGRLVPGSICAMAEKVIAGAEPACVLSGRATVHLAKLRDELSFVDAIGLPIVSRPDGRLVIWSFAGGLVAASLAHALTVAGCKPVNWDDLTVTVGVSDAAAISSTLQLLDLSQAYPARPSDISSVLKFELCLPEHLANSVVIARTASLEAVGSTLVRTHRLMAQARAT